jgi:Protein of unknown function (DUF3467)
MVPIRIFFSIAAAGLLALGASLAASPRPASGEPQRPDPAETKSQADDSPPKHAVPHADQETALEAAKSEVDVSGIQPGYSNFCRVTATPEEVILDFGLNAQPFAMGAQPVKISQRTVVNFYTAKRLLVALETTIRRHEDTFGPIELDVRRRTRSFHQQQQGAARKK